MQYSQKPMTENEAEELLKMTTHFDYLKGRVMKVDLKGDEFDPWGYDRDNGQGAAMNAIAAIVSGGVNSPEIQETHRVGKLNAAADVMAKIDSESTVKQGENGTTITLGLSDVAHALEPAVKKAVEDK